MFIKDFRVCSECGKKINGEYSKADELVFCGTCGQGALKMFLDSIETRDVSDELVPGNKKYYVIFDRLSMVEIGAKDEEEAWEIANAILENEDLDWTEPGIKEIEEDNGDEN
jgi:hypothetical protein